MFLGTDDFYSLKLQLIFMLKFLKEDYLVQTTGKRENILSINYIKSLF